MIKSLFWIFLGIIIYAYLGYTLLLWVIFLVKRWVCKRKIIPEITKDNLPEVTLFISAYNEKEIIREKIINTNQLNYPADKLKQLWVTDGSDDGSVEMLKEYNGSTVLHEKERKGKSHAINRGIPFVKSPVVIFSDANTMLSEDCILKLVSHFHDERTGCVAGEKRLVYTDADGAVGSGEGIYWKYESIIKWLESEINGTISAAGELYAIRTSLFKPIPDDTLVDDFIISLNIARQGYKIKYEPNAYANETSSASMEEEMKRKVRIATGGIQTFLRFPEFLNIFKFGFFSFQYFSHKVLRWTLVPFSFLFIFILNLLLILNFSGFYSLYVILFFIQCLFYLLVLLGAVLKNARLKIKLLFLPYYLFFMNFSIITGYFRYLGGKHTVKWEKAKRN